MHAQNPTHTNDDFLNWIDEQADQFEAAWRSGIPLLKEFVNHVVGGRRLDLLLELIRIDAEHHHNRGSTPTIEDYLADFPELDHRPDHIQELTNYLARFQSDANEKGAASPPERTKLLAYEDTHPQAGRYEVGEVIGTGGMGVVLRADDPELHRALAIKILHHRHREEQALIQRFLEEAQLTSQLQHPGVPPVHEVGTLEDGRPFFAMKLIQGKTLRELLCTRCGPKEDRPRFLSVFEQICQAVGYAHSRGVIHRDLTSHNMMVGAFGEVHVMDWGLARVVAKTNEVDNPESEQSGASTIVTVRTSAETGDRTQTGTVLGTPAYLAPEQARGEVELLDERCDVFGLGAILCEILTGKPPFDQESSLARIQQSIKGDLSEVYSRLEQCDADPELVTLARSCLQPQKEDRPVNGTAVLTAITEYQEGVQQRLQQVVIERAQAETKAIEERKRRRFVIGLTIVATLLTSVFLWGVWFYRRTQIERRASVEKHLTALYADLNAFRLADVDKHLGEARRYYQDLPEVQQIQVNQAETDLHLARKLDLIRLGQLYRQASSEYDAKPTLDSKEYRKLLLECGLSQKQNEDPKIVAQRVQQSRLKQLWITAFDHWLYSGPSKDHKWLREVLKSLDPHSLRTHFRTLWILGPQQAWDQEIHKLELDDTLAELTQPAINAVLLLLIRQKKQKSTEALFHQLQRYDSLGFWANVTLASVSQRIKKPKRVRDHLLICSQQRPQEPIIHAFLCDVYTDLNAWGYVIDHAKMAIGLNRTRHPLRPRFEKDFLAIVHVRLGYACARQGNWDEAIENYREGLELDSEGLPEVHVNLGYAYHHKGDWINAIQQLGLVPPEVRKGPNLKNHRAEMQIVLAFDYAMIGKPDKTQECHATAVQSTEQMSEMYDPLGLVLEQGGKLLGAK